MKNTNNTIKTTNEVSLRYYAIAPVGWHGDWATILVETTSPDEPSYEELSSAVILDNPDCYDEICSYKNSRDEGCYTAKCVVDGEEKNCFVEEDGPFSYGIVPLESDKQRAWW